MIWPATRCGRCGCWDDQHESESDNDRFGACLWCKTCPGFVLGKPIEQQTTTTRED